ncbi:MAG: SAM-dependent methyltransferase [Pseudomonadota bacterium]
MRLRGSDARKNIDMNVLENIIRMQIEQAGPMSMAEFMALALGHPEHGYYMSRDPFGQGGDFTTAPEISQMFGEMIGVWLADTYMRCGAPKQFVLLECGPGRGTLMSDIMRVTKTVPGFQDAMQLHLLETSPTLKKVQGEALSNYQPQWHDMIDSVPTDAPIFIIGNEFFDALPVQHLYWRDGQWFERKVGLDGETFMFVGTDAQPDHVNLIPDHLGAPSNDDIFEFSALSRSLISAISQRIKAQGVAMLFIDYGHEKARYGETLQAVKAHQYAPILDNVGECDLTAHVDFGALGDIARSQGLHVSRIVDQGSFLKALGIEMRAQNLMKNANEVQQNDIQGALARLTDPKQMGALFKVMAATSYDIELAVLV